MLVGLRERSAFFLILLLKKAKSLAPDWWNATEILAPDWLKVPLLHSVSLFMSTETLSPSSFFLLTRVVFVKKDIMA